MSVVSWFRSASGGARALLGFVGRPAFAWGSMTLLAGFVTFALDLVLALALQRFLVSVGLIAASSAPSIFGPIRDAWTEAFIFLAIGTLRCGASWLNAVGTGLCYVAFESGRRHDILVWALHSGRASLGEVTTLFNDVVVGASAAVSNLFFLVSRGVFALGVLVALASYSLLLTGMLLGVVALAVPLQRLIDRRLTRDSKVIQSALASAVDRLVLSVKNSAFLQIHGMVGAEAARGGALVGRYAASSRRYYIDSASRSTIPQLLGLFVVAGIAVQGSTMLGEDKSQIVAYLYLALRLFQNLGEIARFSANLRLNWPRLTILRRWWKEQFAQVQGEVSSARKAAPRPFAVPVGWKVRDVSFAWEQDAPVLRELSFDITPRSSTVIVGPSGTGKSTLLLLLIGLMKPERGTIHLLVEGRETELAARHDSLLASAAYVGPDPFVVPGTIRDFLAFGRAEPLADSDAFVALRRAHCEFVEALPRGLDHELSEQGGGLSAGQKQRLALARALLRRPRVLFLDEATANLDVEAERVIVRTLNELKSEMTIIAVTHRQALLEIADQVIEIGPGALERSGGSSDRILQPISA